VVKKTTPKQITEKRSSKVSLTPEEVDMSTALSRFSLLSQFVMSIGPSSLNQLVKTQ